MNPWSIIRPRLVWIRDRLDEARHPGRRRRAQAVAAKARGGKVLFVCLGNVCRSPYAEWAFKAQHPDIDVASGGFIGPGRAPPERALEAASKRGIDHSTHRSQTIDVEDVRAASLVVIFDRGNQKRLSGLGRAGAGKAIWLGDLDPVWAGKRAVIDPWGRDPAFFDRTFERIDRCLEELAAVLSDGER